MSVPHFDFILAQGLRKGHIPNKTKAARDWYRERAAKVPRVSEQNLIRGKVDDWTKKPLIGNMYMFKYDPKLKNELPYYDVFPLIFPIGPADGGFLGLNMHYLPLNYRAKLMDALYQTTNNKTFDETTKLKINYSILKKATVMNYYKPCIKHYLFGHVRSNFIYMKPEEWDIALFLPTARFMKATEKQVWADSRKLIRG